jgi:hypothetical protein
MVAPPLTLVATCTAGLADERLAGIDEGHAALLQWLDRTVVTLA